MEEVCCRTWIIMILELDSSDEVYIQISCEPSARMELNHYFRFRPKNYQFMPMFRAKKWDGYVYLFNYDSGKIYSGLKQEIKRFANKILYDPISRVGREPLRKLASDNRIILALRLSFLGKKIPTNTLIGLKAALNYYDKNDNESMYLQNLKKSLSENEILKKT